MLSLRVFVQRSNDRFPIAATVSPSVIYDYVINPLVLEFTNRITFIDPNVVALIARVLPAYTGFSSSPWSRSLFIWFYPPFQRNLRHNFLKALPIRIERSCIDLMSCWPGFFLLDRTSGPRAMSL